MAKHASVVLAPWLDQYEPPKTVRHGHARLWYALKELNGGSPHRAVDVLLKGCCELPMYIYRDKTNFKFKPPAAPFRPYLPDTLKAVDLRIRAVVRAVESEGIEAAILLMRRS